MDKEYLPLLDGYNPKVRRVVDDDTDATEGELSGEFDDVIRKGLEYDRQNGSNGWEGLEAETEDEDGLIALAYTSGTTARPKVRVFHDQFWSISSLIWIGCGIYAPWGLHGSHCKCH